MDLGLKGRIALVGGASQGIGFAIARLLASPVLADVHADLQAMLDDGTKGAFEQESLGQAGLRLVAANFHRS